MAKGAENKSIMYFHGEREGEQKYNVLQRRKGGTGKVLCTLTAKGWENKSKMYFNGEMEGQKSIMYFNGEREGQKGTTKV